VRATLILGVLVAAAAVTVTAAGPAPAPVARVATLGSQSTDVWDVFERRLNALGYVEGRNLGLERRWSEGFTERVPALLRELLRAKPDVIVASIMPPSTDLDPALCVPILAIGIAEPYGTCRVFPVANASAASSARLLSETHLRLAKLAVPAAARVSVVTDSTRPFLVEYVDGLRRAAKTRGIDVVVLDVSHEAALDSLVASIVRQGPDVLIVAPGFSAPHARRQLVAQARRLRIPTIGSHIVDGVVVAADYDWRELARRAANFVDQILKGATPAQLDRDAPVKFEVVVDRQAAEAVGLSIPESLLREADHVLD
jgi:putative tryptophan/tyrosine transport system substrate-binding protein